MLVLKAGHGIRIGLKLALNRPSAHELMIGKHDDKGEAEHP